MIPVWKLRRELARVRDQLINLPRKIGSLPMRLGEPGRRAAYERHFATITRLGHGRIPASPKPAIFLIYQPGGIAASTFATCNWLVSHGYAPLIVTNSAVSHEDRARLLDHSWQLLERPNFGYDFGGYRDAVRLLAEAGAQPERLIVMNDSVWCPMAPDLMERLEASPADITGLLQDEKVRHGTDGGQPTDRRHVESYFYMIRGSVWKAPAFQAFWRDYKMTDFKPHTIKFGELGFSSRMVDAGLQLSALSRRSIFLDWIEKADDAFLALTLKYAAYGDADLQRAGDRLRDLDSHNPNWRLAVLEHIRRAVNRKRFNSTFPYANEHIFGTLFMKKSRETIFTNQRRAYLSAVRDGMLLPPPKVILDEIVALVEEQFPGEGQADARWKI